jgi:predicted transposase YbfD/YdcC
LEGTTLRKAGKWIRRGHGTEITSLTAREVGPEHIAAYIRSHRGIENLVNLVRDVTLREDSSTVRAQPRPWNLATPP